MTKLFTQCPARAVNLCALITMEGYTALWWVAPSGRADIVTNAPYAIVASLAALCSEGQ